jgi:hypothetical protein
MFIKMIISLLICFIFNSCLYDLKYLDVKNDNTDKEWKEIKKEEYEKLKNRK